MKKNLIFLKLALFSALFSVAQVRNLEAVKITTPPRLDGSLDDAAWQGVPAATDFITNTPVFGKPPVVNSSIKVVYDNTAIYIGAYLYDQPGNIRKQMTLRDSEQRADVDYFAVFLDTYRDKQNAFQFLVTSRNVQTDSRVSPNYEANDFNAYGDVSWDAVWDSRVSIRSDGWVVEIKIPYSAIRFSKEDIQNWGIQFMRFTRINNETSFWSPVDPNVSGFVNQFGELSGLKNLVPPLRLSFSPYVSGGYRSNPSASGNYKNEWLKSGGMDVKYGISESFTLDATLIPDFGQVISDNLVNNITPYELQFRENRPFFTEGTELFNKAGVFYSRRIGRTPTLYNYVNNQVGMGILSDYEVVKNPEVTRLYNAIKFSGRTKNKLGIGIFNAVTQPVRARLRDRFSGRDSLITTEPLANYNIIVLDQAFKNRSYVTLTNTNVLRNGHERDANVTAVNVAVYNKNNTYGFFLQPKYSKVFGQNPYEGFANYIEFGKVSGKFQFSLNNNIESDKYDPNDLGILQAPNEVVNNARFSYNIYEPTKRFLNQYYNLDIIQAYLYKPMVYQRTEIVSSALFIFKNFWDVRLQLSTAPFWFNDYFELQTPVDPRATPRVALKRAPYYFGGISGSSDSRKRLFVRWNFGFAQGPMPADPYYIVGLGGRFRFSDRLTIDLFVERQHDNGQFGFSFERDNLTGAPILARRKYTDVNSLLTGSYSFTPRMNMSFRARHYWNKLANTNLYDVRGDGYWDERFDRVPSDYDVNYNTFSLDVFYTWDFRLGSRIIIGWKNWLGRDFEYLVDGRANKYYGRNFTQVFDNPHGNEFTVRFIYYLDYLQLKRK
ncbi:MAG TPA: DUF5916 domain-containing protein [Chitinophagaceae bacterium]|nr:DUF5916 domain-containing protein [Chitinophagaceae bacterium]